MSKLFEIFVTILTITTIDIASATYGKIKGGRAAKAGEFPFIGQIVYKSEKAKFCGCALATTTRVVTAAHCVTEVVEGKKEDFPIETGEVYFGTLYLFSEEGQKSKLKAVHYSDQLRLKSDGSFMHDYATADLQTPLKLTDTVKLLPIYSTDKKEFKNGWDEFVASKGKCFVIGWGATSYKIENGQVVTGTVSKYLKTAVAVPWDEQRCAPYTGRQKDSMLPFGEVCLLGDTYGETILPGDSGSPLMCGDYVWGVCATMVVDDAGRHPFQYVLHWHYLNDLLYPSSSAIYPNVSFPLFFIILLLNCRF